MIKGVEIASIIRGDCKGYYCEDYAGQGGWIQRSALRPDGTVSRKAWDKAVAESNERLISAAKRRADRLKADTWNIDAIDGRLWTEIARVLTVEFPVKNEEKQDEK